MKITLFNVVGRMSSDGSRLISALLKREGHHVKTIFFARPDPLDYSPEEFEPLHEILLDTDLVLVAVYSSYAIRAVQLSNFIRKHYPGLTIIWGGPHCISVPKLCLDYADGVCFSEGDTAIIEVVKKMESGEDFYKTPNMAFNVDGAKVANDYLQPFQDLDELPYYDYALDDQFLLDRGLSRMTKEILNERMAGYPYYIPIYYVVTSRGCPHNCSYCNNCRYINMFHRNSIRFQSVGRAVDELKHTLEILDFVKMVGIGDDDFFMRPKAQIEEFAKKYKKHIGLPFGVAVSANSFRKEKMEILLDCGLKAVQMGVQSGSQRVLDDVYNRNVKVSKTKDVIRQIESFKKTYRLDLLLDFIIDNPYETRDDIIQTYNYILDLPEVMRINLFFLAFFPGTPIYDKALEDGIIEPFNEKAFRFYTRSQLRYQKNYETFLVLLIRSLSRHPKYRPYIPGFFLRALATMPVRAIASVFPESFYSYLSKVVQ